MCVGCVLDGQKIAKRLAKQIARESKTIKDWLLEYNQYCLDDDDKLVLSSVFNVEVLSTLLTVVHSSPERNKKQEIFEEYLLLLRSHEEIELLEAEVNNARKHYLAKKATIEAEIVRHSDSLSSLSAIQIHCHHIVLGQSVCCARCSQTTKTNGVHFQSHEGAYRCARYYLQQ